MMETLFENLTSGSMVFLIRQTLIYAVPLMIVALAGVYAERSGVINLALEGIMIFGAFIGVLFVRLVQQWGWFDAVKAADNWVGLQGFMLLTMAVSALLGAIFSLLLAFAAITCARTRPSAARPSPPGPRAGAVPHPPDRQPEYPADGHRRQRQLVHAQKEHVRLWPHGRGWLPL